MIRLAMLTAGEDLGPITEATKDYVGDIVTHSGHYSEGMATLRNKLLEKARCGLGPNDYLLLLDPDERPQDTFPDVELTEPLYLITYRGGGETWEKEALLRVDAMAHYERSVHEFLDSPYEPVLLEGFEVEQPSSSSSRERQQWKLAQLLTEIDDPRSVYYLAQTYDCLEMKGEALRWYLMRSRMGGWEEERWHALYKAACLAENWDWELARLLFERARFQRPSRPEPYYRLARFYGFPGADARAWYMAHLGSLLSRCTDQLFVNRWMESELKVLAERPVGGLFP